MAIFILMLQDADTINKIGENKMATRPESDILDLRFLGKLKYFNLKVSVTRKLKDIFLPWI